MVVFLHFQSAFCQILEPSSFQLWPPWEFDSSPFRHVPNLKAKSRKLGSPPKTGHEKNTEPKFEMPTSVHLKTQSKNNTKHSIFENI